MVQPPGSRRVPGPVGSWIVVSRLRKGADDLRTNDPSRLAQMDLRSGKAGAQRRMESRRVVSYPLAIKRAGGAID